MAESDAALSKLTAETTDREKLVAELEAVTEERNAALSQLTAAKSARDATLTKSSVVPPQSAPPVKTGVYEKIVTFRGREQKDTDSFQLASGKVKIVGTSWPRDGASIGALTHIKLESEDGTRLRGDSLTMDSNEPETLTAETIVRGVKTGTYYVSVNSTGHWEVSIYQER